MNKKDPFNLFSERSRKLNKLKKSSSAASNQSASSLEKLDNLEHSFPSSNEIKEMVHKMRDMYDKLNLQIEETYRRAGLNATEVKRYLDNPNNFDPQQWKNLQNEREALLRTIWKDLGTDEKKILDIQSKKQQKNLEKTKKERKSKTLGARRNWIPIR